MKALHDYPAINGWQLFWLLSVPMSAVMVVATMRVDLGTPDGVAEMIGFSVRWAVPFIYLVVASSAVRTLFPHPASYWLLRNRKYLGLCFAVAMAWQGLFIFVMSNVHSDHYYREIFFLRDELEGSTGYIFLTALVVTSFPFGRRHLTPRQWRLLHRCGIYFLWAYPFSVYWWNLSYYDDPQPIDYVYYWSGFFAFALRIAAWGRKRQQAAARFAPRFSPLALKLPGAAIIALGVVVAATGRQWQEPMTAMLTAPAWSANLELWLPYWPFEPFLSLAMIAFGTLLATKAGVPAGIEARQSAV